MSRSRLTTFSVAAGLPLAILFAIGLVWSGDGSGVDDPRVIDFGQMAPGRPLSHRFVLHNATGRSITFRDLEAGDLCRCRVELPEHPNRRIPADVLFPVVVRMTAPERPGAFFREAVLRTDSEVIGFDAVRLSMSGEVVVAARAVPPALVFDVDPSSSNPKRDLVIEAEGFDLPSELIDIQPDLEHLAIVPLAAEAGRLQYTVEVLKTMPLGTFQGSLVATFRDQRLGTLRIPVLGEQRSDLDVVPNAVYWNSRRGGSSRHRLRIVSRSGLPISIKDIETPEGVRVEFDRSEQQAHDVQLMINAKTEARSELRIVTLREDGVAADTGIRVMALPQDW